MEIIYTIIISSVFFILGILATYLFGFRKILRCIVVPSVSLIDVSKEVQNKTKIFYNDSPVKNLSSTTIKIRNSSFSHITDDDFKSKLKIIFDESIKLIDFEILEKSYSEREVDIEIKDNIATISKLTLLNRYEYFILRLIHHGTAKERVPNIMADIKGFKTGKIEGFLEEKGKSNYVLIDGIFNTLFGIFFGFIVLALASIFVHSIEKYTFSGICTLSGITIVSAITFLFLFYSGLKKIYNYFVRIIVIKSKEKILNG